jgi:hypothetical protein
MYSIQLRIGFAAAARLATLGATLGVASIAQAQVVSAPLELQLQPAWSFAVAPYGWLPTISSTISYTGPRGGTVSTDINAGVGDYISKLNFALFVGGEARYDRFTLMTDLIYANVSLTTNNTHLSSVNLGSGPLYIPREQQLGTGTRASTTVWSLAGGYTLLHGDWGNIDAVAGLRMLFYSSTTNYMLTADFFGPNRTLALSRTGSLNLGTTKPEGIAGVTGRINIPNSKFYLPYYLDAGGGAVPFTWQVYAGVGYGLSNWADISVGYRYLSFQNGGDKGVENLDLGGPLFAANFRF